MKASEGIEMKITWTFGPILECFPPSTVFIL